MMERGGKLRTQVVEKEEPMNCKTLEKIMKRNIDTVKSFLITDDYKGYQPMATKG